MEQRRCQSFLLLKHLPKEYNETACYLLCNRFFYIIKHRDDNVKAVLFTRKFVPAYQRIRLSAGMEITMTELERCMAGENYNCHDKIFLDFKSHARELLKKYNALAYEQKEEKESILKELFGEIGTKVTVAFPFLCDYGRNIYVGNNVSVNMNCTFVDCNKITIGDNVLIASNVQLYTATHPVELAERYAQDLETEQFVRRTYALPIKIGNGCWLGGGVIVLPGVTIGDGSVIGAGSVVTKDIPENSLALGNPCRVVQKINGGL